MLYQGVRILGYMTVLLLLLVHTTCGDMCLLQMQVQLSYGCCWLDVLYVCVSVLLQALGDLPTSLPLPVKWFTTELQSLPDLPTICHSFIVPHASFFLAFLHILWRS